MFAWSGGHGLVDDQYANWLNGAPAADDARDCAAMVITDSANRWNNEDCVEETHAFICEIRELP